MTTRDPGARVVLTHGLACEAAGHGAAGHQARGHHDLGVGGVGAAGDGGHHHVRRPRRRRVDPSASDGRPGRGESRPRAVAEGGPGAGQRAPGPGDGRARRCSGPRWTGRAR